MGRNRYYLAIDDFAQARGGDARFAFDGAGPNDLAADVTAALRTPDLFTRWRAVQADPDAVDAALGATDAAATVAAHVAGVTGIAMELVTTLPLQVIRHRLNLLIGAHWTVRDVRAG